MNSLSCFLTIAVLALANARRCEVPCTREYRPVCGSDGEHLKVFANMCLLRNENCKNGHKWLQTLMGECQAETKVEEEQNCEVPCTREFRPICGTDGEHFKIFANSCVLRNQHCKDGQNWFQALMNSCGNNNEKQLTVSEDCRKMCPALYAPVCGFDGQTYQLFSNKCIMETNNCRYHNNWLQTSMENCENKVDN